MNDRQNEELKASAEKIRQELEHRLPCSNDMSENFFTEEVYLNGEIFLIDKVIITYPFKNAGSAKEGLTVEKLNKIANSIKNTRALGIKKCEIDIKDDSIVFSIELIFQVSYERSCCTSNPAIAYVRKNIIKKTNDIVNGILR